MFSSALFFVFLVFGSMVPSEGNMRGRFLFKRSKAVFAEPTVSASETRTHRVGAMRDEVFGARCWDKEPCDQCVCCGTCNPDTNVCHSPPGSVEYCDRNKGHGRIVAKIPYSLPDDWPVEKRL